jgi:geranylgeranyl diphosphate synthase type II
MITIILNDLRDYLAAKRDRVEVHLRHVVDPGPGCPPALLEAMRYSLLAPGKRLRPLLVILATEACVGDGDTAVAAASAVEMIHTYSLIHDDLPAMDDDDLRRGLPTCHKKFGEALAILAGDALLTLAFQVLAESYPAATAAGACRELARGAGAAGMVGGQVEDIQISDLRVQRSDRAPDLQTPICNLQSLETIHARKTGALFRSCLRLGAWVAHGEKPGGPDALTLERLDGYGNRFGLLFQITDDLLDVESTAEQTGKRVQKDAARGKLTYPGFLGIEESRRRARQVCDEACEQLRPFGPAGERLAAFARMIVSRDR